MQNQESDEVTEEEQKASDERLVKYRAWIRGGHRKGRIRFEKICVETEHSPMVLFNRENPSKVDSVICRVCTDTLPTPVTLSCDECWVIAVDGYLHIETCTKHEEEPVLS